MTAPIVAPEMRLVLDQLAEEDSGLADPSSLPAAEGRAQSERVNRRWNAELPPMAAIRSRPVRRADGSEVPLTLLVPEGAGPGLILFIHGGGWCFCSTETHARAARLLAIEAATTVALFDYRLAPEHPYPAGLEDCIAVWRQAADAPGPLAVAGDSAGANLALALMLHEIGADRRLPDLALLFYGVYGADFDTPSYRDCEEGPGLTRAKMLRYWDWYTPTSARGDPLVAPLGASDAALTALPPLYLNAAEVDPLRSDTIALARRLEALGRKDPFRLHRGVVHGFMQMTSRLKAARTATTEAGAAFRRLAGLDPTLVNEKEETPNA